MYKHTHICTHTHHAYAHININVVLEKNFIFHLCREKANSSLLYVSSLFVSFTIHTINFISHISGHQMLRRIFSPYQVIFCNTIWVF